VVSFELTLKGETTATFNAAKQTKYRAAVAESLSVDAKYVALTIKAGQSRNLVNARSLQAGLVVEVEVNAPDQEKYLNMGTALGDTTAYAQKLVVALGNQSITVDVSSLYIAPESVTTTLANPPAAASSSPVGIIVGVLVALLLIVGGGGFYYMQQQKKSTKPAKIYQADEPAVETIAASPAPKQNVETAPEEPTPIEQEAPVEAKAEAKTSAPLIADQDEKEEDEDLGPSILGPNAAAFGMGGDDDDEDDDDDDDDDDAEFEDLNILGPPAWIAERWTTGDSGDSAGESEAENN
jgi:hypothetical protein